ncbi:MAG: hypothetical protein KDD65_09990 [Bacteroidetes bacterium]|nr:hypothetical protein [Bacteroidota bacterium]
MGILGQSRRVRPRQFDYEPRYYNPSKDRGENIRRRIQIKSKASRGRKTSAMYLVMLFVMVVWAYLKLKGIS